MKPLLLFVLLSPLLLSQKEDAKWVLTFADEFNGMELDLMCPRVADQMAEEDPHAEPTRRHGALAMPQRRRPPLRARHPR